MNVTCSRLYDGKVSICVRGAEVYVLPDKEEATLQDLERALVAVVRAVTGYEAGPVQW